MLPINDYIFSLIAKLVSEHRYSIIKSSEQTLLEEDKEVHLIKEMAMEYHYIHIVPTNFIWPNHLANDIQGTKRRAEHFLNVSNNKWQKIKVLNLYVFQASPSEEIKQVLMNASTEEKNIKMFVGYIDLEKLLLGVPNDVFDMLKLPKEVFTQYFSEPIPIPKDEVIKEIRDTEKRRVEKVKKIFNFGRPMLTYIFIVVNAILFLLMTFHGGSTDTSVLIHYGALEGFFVSQGEYWRLITPIFLHIGIIHFLLNNFAIYYIGRLTEQIYGSYRFFSIYMLAGIIGNFAGFIFQPEYVSAGASGAIFGLFGALLYFGYSHPRLFIQTIGKDIITIIVINIIFGLTAPNIGNYAHIGGLIGGFLIAAIIKLPNQKKKTYLLQTISVLLILVILSATYWGVFIREVKGSYQILSIGVEDINQGKDDEALKIFQHLTKNYPDDPYSNFYYGVVLTRKGDFKDAEESYKLAIQHKPNFFEAHYNLAFIYHVTNTKQDEAISHLHQALEINPNFKQAQDLLEAIENGNNK